MTYQLGTSVPFVDLAQALEGEYGTYIADIDGQNFLAVSEEGHSLVVFRPFGPKINAQNTTPTGAPACWVTKISNKNIVGEYTGTLPEFARTGTRG